MTPQRSPVHCAQPLLAHALPKRKRLSGERPRRAICTNSASTTIRSLAKATRPSGMTMPTRIAPSCRGELGQRIFSESIRLDLRWRVSSAARLHRDLSGLEPDLVEPFGHVRENRPDWPDPPAAVPPYRYEHGRSPRACGRRFGDGLARAARARAARVGLRKLAHEGRAQFARDALPNVGGQLDAAQFEYEVGAFLGNLGGSHVVFSLSGWKITWRC